MIFNRPFLRLAFLLNADRILATPAIYARYSNSTSVSSSTLSLQTFSQQDTTTISTTSIPSYGTVGLSTSIPATSQRIVNAAPTRELSQAVNSTASPSRASRTASSSAAYGSAYLSLASGVQLPGQSSPSHNATGPASHANHTSPSLLDQVTSVLAAQVTGSGNATRNFTAILLPAKASSTTGVNNLLAAVGQIASLSGADPASATGLRGLGTPTMSASKQPTTTNALSILESAVPSSFVESIQSQWESITSDLLDASSTTAPQSTQHSSIPTPTHILPSPLISHSTSSSTPTSSILTTSSTQTPSTLLTVAAHPTSATSSSTASATAAGAGGSAQLKNASVAGIATGVAAGAVLIVLGGLVWYRRRQQQGKGFFGGARGGSQRSSKRGSKRIFPEVAWLYDPQRTPAGSPPEQAETAGLVAGRYSRSASVSSLVPEPRDGAVEMSSAPPSPPMHPARPSNPLLAPVVAGSSSSQSPQGRRSQSASPNGRRSGSQSPIGRKPRSSLGASRETLTRPMSAIYEEQQARPSMEVRQGLLAPGNVNLQRHST